MVLGSAVPTAEYCWRAAYLLVFVARVVNVHSVVLLLIRHTTLDSHHINISVLGNDSNDALFCFPPHFFPAEGL